ncbi:beta-CASP ribonuclease aCPSF1 [Nanoarchaeota archaeon NZ13-N]|nr:MAG: beta-CASP ribonuclease aCPSF1 [Nanoarchaeota archaeon NZ13-N]
MMNDIKTQILSEFKESDVEKVVFEAAKIIVYVTNKEIFLNGFEIGKNLAQKYKKRIEIRLSPKILENEEKIIEKCEEILNKYKIKYKNIFLERHRSIIVIDTYQPEKIDEGVIREIREKTFCNIVIKRSPLKSSRIIDIVRSYLHKKSKYRVSFLNKVGERIVTRKSTLKRGNYRIIFLGGTREVGRSCILLKTDESSVLLDCGVGMDVGTEKYPAINIEDFNILDLDAAIITHAHLDHIGFIPYLFRLGWKGPVYLTEPTRDIGSLSMLDYVKISKMQGKKSLYEAKDIKEFLKHTYTLGYREVTDITPDIKICLYDAGHVIGSSMVHINIENKHNILYTGDFKYMPTKLLNKPKTLFQRLETLIIESTYGGNNDYHPPREETEKMFIKDIKDVLKDNGKVLIPVLSVGRAQDILLTLIENIENGELPRVNIYTEGILWETSMIHTAYPEFLSDYVRTMILGGENLFEKEYIVKVNPKERDQIIESKEPYIVVSTSGMMQGGPILEYFKRLANDERNLLAFVSYQAQGTLGRRILDGEKSFIIDSEKIEVKIKYKKYDGFSGHADRREILGYIKHLKPKPKQIFVVHGEHPKYFELVNSIRIKLNIEAYAPKLGDSLLLNL